MEQKKDKKDKSFLLKRKKKGILIGPHFLEEMAIVCSEPNPGCHQQQVQNPGSVMVWGRVNALCKGHLDFSDGTNNAEKVH